MSCCCPALALLLLALGCSGNDTRGQHIDVYAASSLRPVFEELAAAFEDAHPEWTVRYNFAGSQVLRMQIEQGADADVFASADELQMQRLVSSRRGVEPAHFASNALVLAVPRDSSLQSIEDIAQASRVVIGTEASPIGAYTRRLLERAGALYGGDFEARAFASVVSEESNAGLVRAKVELGVADAAIIYRSDTASARFRVITLPESLYFAAPYHVAVVKDSPAAQAFVRLLRSPEGRELLVRHEFSLP